MGYGVLPDFCLIFKVLTTVLGNFATFEKNGRLIDPCNRGNDERNNLLRFSYWRVQVSWKFMSYRHALIRLELPVSRYNLSK